MSLLIFGIFFAVLWLLIEIMAILMKLTGLELNKARFQIISILTHTGFTTRESELIVQHPTRRRIASVLMMLSYVAQLTLIGLLFNALYNDRQSMPELFVVICVVVLVILVLANNKTIRSRFDRLAEKVLARRMKEVRGYKIDRILNLSPEYSIYELVVDAHSPLCDKTLREAHLKEKFIQILKIDRGEKVVDFPTAETVILQGDRIIVYGKIAAISQCVLSREAPEEQS